MRTLVRGGTVVTAVGTFTGDVLSDGETIAAVGVSLDAGSDDQVIDAAGCFVLPGLIDNHTHLDMPFGGTVTADDWESGTRAAAAGGTTTLVDFALQTDGSLLRGLEAWHAKAEGKAHIDYGFHLAVSDASDAAIAEMETAVAEGVTSFKLFMAYKGALMVSDEEMLRVMERARDLGALTQVHAENGDAVDHFVREALAAGDSDPRFHAVTRPPAVEGEATRRAIELATWARAPLFVVHVTCREALEQIQLARDLGLPVYGETCVQYLTLTVDELARPGFEGAKYVCSPPLRPVEHQAPLWAALRNGGLQGCSTDQCSFNYEGEGGKQLGVGDFSKIPNGMPGIETRLPLLWHHGVRTGKLTPSELVAVTSTGPARLFGLAERKGTIAPGLDADLVVLDPEREVTITAATQEMAVDYTPYEGWVVRGAPRTVLSRGEVVYAEGEVRSRPGRGRFLARALHESARPAVAA